MVTGPPNDNVNDSDFFAAAGRDEIQAPGVGKRSGPLGVADVPTLPPKQTAKARRELLQAQKREDAAARKEAKAAAKAARKAGKRARPAPVPTPATLAPLRPPADDYDATDGTAETPTREGLPKGIVIATSAAAALVVSGAVAIGATGLAGGSQGEATTAPAATTTAAVKAPPAVLDRYAQARARMEAAAKRGDYGQAIDTAAVLGESAAEAEYRATAAKILVHRAAKAAERGDLDLSRERLSKAHDRYGVAPGASGVRAQIKDVEARRRARSIARRKAAARRRDAARRAVARRPSSASFGRRSAVPSGSATAPRSSTPVPAQRAPAAPTYTPPPVRQSSPAPAPQAPTRTTPKREEYHVPKAPRPAADPTE